MMTGICMDGPLIGETIRFDGTSWKVAIPPRVTMCDCNSEGRLEEVASHPPEEVIYRPILMGINRKVAFLSIQDNEEKILSEMREFVMTDLGGGMKRLVSYCRDRRAFR